MSRLNFKLQAVATGSAARAGHLCALHGEVKTPVFMPVGTQATVKGMRADDLKAIGAQVLLANTYHLLLRPGAEVFRHFGGINKFMDWDRPVLTDSGGFQIFSLPGSRKMTEDGAIFKSYVDGTLISLSPEVSIDMQRAIGSDIMMVLDECVPSTSSRDVAAAAMERTHRWAKRSLAARGDSPQSMFAIVQGACFEDLRRISADALTSLPFDGFAIGGLAVGETKGEREHFTGVAAAMLPTHLPRYLMGVGTPIDLLEAVHRGVDMFDCILPAAHAQQGTAYTWDGALRFRRSAYKFAEGPIEEGCTCFTCKHYSRAYVHHLVKAGEGLGWRLIAYHNLWFYQELMAKMRSTIFDDTFAAFYAETRTKLALKDGEPGPPQKPKTNVPPLREGRFEIREIDGGRGRIHDTASGEGIHPGATPDDEAQALYVEGSRLGLRLKEESTAPFVIWDVGLGAGHNAMAAVRCLEAAIPSRPAELVSFENDLGALRLCLKHIRRFPHLKHGAPKELAQSGFWRAKAAPISWRLFEGDFHREKSRAAPPDLIFFDPFSAKTDSEMWTLASFQMLLAACQERDVEVYTYSTATPVRAAMLAAGFYVATLAGHGDRQEATVAYTAAAWQRVKGDAAAAPLGERWLERWERSSARYPYGLNEDQHEAFASQIRNHPQFV